jgi:hypothetical protein
MNSGCAALAVTKHAVGITARTLPPCLHADTYDSQRKPHNASNIRLSA